MTDKIKITHMQFVGRRRAFARIRAELPLGDWNTDRYAHLPILCIREVINAYIDAIMGDLREHRRIQVPGVRPVYATEMTFEPYMAYRWLLEDPPIMM